MKIAKSVFGLLLFVISLNLFSQEKGLLWEVTKKGSKKSYLYGTIHLKVNDVFEYGEEVEVALQSVEEFNAELDFDNVNHILMMQEMMMPQDLQYEDLYKDSVKTKEVKSFILKHVPSYGEMAFRIKPIYIEMLLIESLMKGEREKSLDEYLYAISKESGKDVGGLETLDEQLKAIRAISLEMQADELYNVIQDYEENGIEVENDKLIALYLNQDLAGLERLINEFSADAKLYKKKLLYDRNKTMVKRMTNKMVKKSMFVAVGAGHLGGEKGLIGLLKGKGYTVKAVPFEFD